MHVINQEWRRCPLWANVTEWGTCYCTEWTMRWSRSNDVTKKTRAENQLQTKILILLRLPKWILCWKAFQILRWLTNQFDNLKMERTISFIWKSILRSFVLRRRQWSTEFFSQGNDPEKRWVPGFSFVKKETPTPTLEPPLKQGVRFLFLSRCLGFQTYIVPVYGNYTTEMIICLAFFSCYVYFLPCNLSLRWHL